MSSISKLKCCKCVTTSQFPLASWVCVLCQIPIILLNTKHDTKNLVCIFNKTDTLTLIIKQSIISIVRRTAVGARSPVWHWSIVYAHLHSTPIWNLRRMTHDDTCVSYRMSHLVLVSDRSFGDGKYAHTKTHPEFRPRIRSRIPLGFIHTKSHSLLRVISDACTTAE